MTSTSGRLRKLFPAAFLSAGLLALASLTPAALAGRTGPSLSLSPSLWVAGPILSGATSSETFTLTNSGGRSSGKVSVSLSGTGASAFSITADSCTGNRLAAGHTCSVTVEYAPTTASESDNATLRAEARRVATSAALSGTSY